MTKKEKIAAEVAFNNKVDFAKGIGGQDGSVVNAYNKRCAVVGAMLVHPIIFLVAFAYGVFHGAVLISGRAQSARDGLVGGRDAMFNVVIIYGLTVGLVPLVASGLGAMVGVTYAFVFPRKAIP